MRPRVHVLGNSVVDILVPGVWPEGQAGDSWAGNVTLLRQPVQATLGGCGAAPAYVLGRLGACVRLTTNLGLDRWATMLRGWLEAACVEMSPGTAEATAVNVIVLDECGGRRSLYYTGGRVAWQECLQEPAPQWLLASGYGAVQADDLAVLTRVFTAQRQRGAMIAFDPGPWFRHGVSREQMLTAWEQVDCLVGTAAELRAWLPAAPPDGEVDAALAHGPAVVVSKRGADGAAFGTTTGVCGRSATVALRGRNTVGAGDTFNGRLVYGLAAGEPVPKAVQAAVELASAAVRSGCGVLGAFVQAPP